MKVEHSEKFEESRKQLNLQLNYEGIYERESRVQGTYPVYLPSSSALSEKIISQLTERVASRMAAVRSLF